MGIFVLSQVAVLVSQIPAGLGLFEAVILGGLAPAVTGHATLLALLLYRAIYFALPLLAASVSLGVGELQRLAHHG
jgi:uncharacterized membrane protein YbhN (UPF0104 family)